MPPALSKAEVERVAALAHLALTDEEKTLFGRQLADILAYAEQVQEVDTSNVPPTSHVLVRHEAWREDTPRPCLSPEEALANAPEPAHEAGLFKVPRVIGG